MKRILKSKNIATAIGMIIGILLIIFGLTGCSKCIKSHEIEGKCISYTYIRIGNYTQMIPHYYTCTKTICDEYEDGENE